MKKHPLPILVSCVLILASVSVMAAPVEVSVEPELQTGQLYSASTFNITITNNQDFDDIFQLVYSGERLEWRMPGLIAKSVPARSSAVTEVMLYPTGSGKGTFEFTVSAIPFRNPGFQASAEFTLDIPYDFSVRSFLCSYSGSEVSFEALIQAPGDKVLEGEFSVKDSSGKTYGPVLFRETVSGENRIKESFAPEGMLAAGTSTCYLSVGNVSSYFSFSVPPVHSISQKVEERSYGLSKEVLISVTNDGNVVEEGYSFRQSVPLDPMTGMMTRPGDNCAEEGGKMVCTYLVGDISPGATAQVSYTVSYWPAFNGYVLLTVIVIGLVLFSFLRATSPRISKRHSGRGGGTHNIFISVKNPFLHRLNDVVVRDWVSPLAQVLQEEIESARPVVRKLDEGTELIWKLGEMKPREERILQYKVRSLIQGSLKMPGANLKFTTGKEGDKRLKLASNGITLT
jgi:hypothetical protein